MFLVNGFITGSWAPKIPAFAQRHGLSESQLGFVILAFGVGSLCAMPLMGAWVAREGSQRIVRMLSVATAFTLLPITLAPNVALAAGAAFAIGAALGGMDVTMNANAVAVERAMGRAIMSSCHGFWSLGGLLGAASGGFAIEHLGVLTHAVAVTLVCCVGVVALWPRVFDDRAAAQADASTTAKPDDAGLPPQHRKLPLTPLPWLLGLMALFAMTPEGTVLDWGALYLRKELAATVTESGFAFGAFSATMAMMRFAGDTVRDRLGAVLTLRVSALTGCVGLALAAWAPTPALAVAGFAITGVGLANVVPIVFSAAGNLPGLAPGIGLSVVTFMGYAGVLFAPTTLGFVAEAVGFAAIFMAMPLLLLVVLALSPLGRHANMQDGQR